MSLQTEKFDPIRKNDGAPLSPHTMGDDLYLRNLRNIGLPIEKVLLSDELPENLFKGWIVDFSDSKLIHTFNAKAYTLRPGKWVNPFGDAFKAWTQLRKWKKELGGDVVFLLVSDTAQGEKPWFAAPVRRDWLTEMNPESLFALYDHAKIDDPKKMQYRAAFIVVAGCKPEEFTHA
jgi:hypothetical protein